MRTVWKQWRSRIRTQGLILLFTLALILTLLLSSGSLSRSQNRQPTNLKDLTEQIEARAVSHAQIGEQLYLNEVYKEFKNNNLGLGRTEIHNIYEKKFREERDI